MIHLNNKRASRLHRSLTKFITWIRMMRMNKD